MESLQINSLKHTRHNNQILAHISSFIGSGCIESIFLKSGLHLTLSNYQTNKPVKCSYISNTMALGFSFCLTGHTLSHPSCLKEPFTIKSGQSLFFSFPTETEFTGTMRSCRIFCASITMPLSFFYSLADDDPDFFASSPTELLKKIKNPYHASRQITPAMGMILNEMFSCPYQGISRQLFLEGKVMELMAHKMEQLRSTDRSHKNKRLTSDDIDRVHHAASLMSSDLGKHQNISDLAQTVGMCRSKLHRCFNSVYGISPFEYLRKQRLDRAIQLLKDGEISVTEAAYSVGYFNLSYFAKTFKKHVGVSPSQFQNSCPPPYQI